MPDCAVARRPSGRGRDVERELAAPPQHALHLHAVGAHPALLELMSCAPSGFTRNPGLPTGQSDSIVWRWRFRPTQKVRLIGARPVLHLTGNTRTGGGIQRPSAFICRTA
jgi:hypothetical protein